MITIYDLLEVEEKASKQDIEKSYFKLVEEYKIDPNFSEEENNDNEIILRKLKLAYEILMDDEKRKRYDNDLAKKRAEELIANVVLETPSNENDEINSENRMEDNTKKDIVFQKDNIKKQEENNIEYEEEYEETTEVELTNSEKQKIKKAAEKEFKQNLKKAQKAEEEYNKAYNEAYNDYLRKMGFSVKEPWTFSRVRNLIVGLFIITFIGFIIWKLPLTRNLLIQLYEENFIVHSLVDIAIKLINIIISIFK